MNEKIPVYLTGNRGKFEEAQRTFKEKYGFDIDIKNPDFEIIEPQASTCTEVVAFSVKYACEKLGRPCIKSDSGLYIDALGGLPGPYNHYFDVQLGVEKFLELFKNETNRKARLENCFAYCEPGKEPVVFTGGGTGTIALEAKGTLGRWHDKFYIPDGETKTLSELREADRDYEDQFWGNAKEDFAQWFKENIEK
ncbi:MAG: non-canonical purine NTP pyrophosphatase [Bacilli bacterium]|nr:non-canonical purine NTP pyrophosphatase [Bacilli bacterium]